MVKISDIDYTFVDYPFEGYTFERFSKPNFANEPLKKASAATNSIIVPCNT